MSPAAALRAVKALHTLVWAFFASCVLALQVVAWRADTKGAWLLIGVVLVEVMVLALNRWRCPLTAVAARYTAERRDNFDIYLPLWLARRNKVVFGALYVFALLTVAARWVGDQSR